MNSRQQEEGSALVISLTAIPPRFPYLGETLASLLDQRAEVESVNLYLPRRYRRFEWDSTQLPRVPEGVNIRLVDEDLGPATKVLPAAREYRDRRVSILFCDDDKVYDPDWAQRFVDCSRQHPDCCIVEEGGDVAHYSRYQVHGTREPRARRRKKDLSYRLRRLASLGLWKPRKSSASGYVDVLEGWGGVLVKPGFFNDAAYRIPEILWLVDDIWLSGQLALNGVPIWLNADAAARAKGNSNEVSEASLRKLVYQGHGRVEANQACIDYFRQEHGIWL
jgi:hypothetical protein